MRIIYVLIQAHCVGSLSIRIYQWYWHVELWWASFLMLRCFPDSRYLLVADTSRGESAMWRGDFSCGNADLLWTSQISILVTWQWTDIHRRKMHGLKVGTHLAQHVMLAIGIHDKKKAEPEQEWNENFKLTIQSRIEGRGSRMIYGKFTFSQGVLWGFNSDWKAL